MNPYNFEQQQGNAPQQQQFEGPTGPRLIEAKPIIYDGKRMRKLPVSRKVIDYNSTAINWLQERTFQRTPFPELPFMPAHPAYDLKIMPPPTMTQIPASSICTKFNHASTNKDKCPINVVCWTPEGRRMITGTAKGEFTLWNGMAFNFETIQQAHDHPVRSMVWSHNELFMISSDNGGIIKYWQPNMNNLKAFQGHKEVVRDLAFCPTDFKFASCSDDGNVKIWNFETCKEERALEGHGGDVKTCHWHPHNSLVASGAKDYLVKVWDAKSGSCIVNLHGHKNALFRVRWHNNGNWLLSCARDQLIKLYDIRYLKEFHTFRGHKKEVTTVSWHPFQETLFASGGYDGSLMFWLVGSEVPQGRVPKAHESAVWDLAWHPTGHILGSCSNDQTTKFWCRNRLGDRMRDKYNVDQLAEGTMIEEDPTGKRTLKHVQLQMQQQQQQQQQQQSQQQHPHHQQHNANFAIPGFAPDMYNAKQQQPVPPMPMPPHMMMQMQQQQQQQQHYYQQQQQSLPGFQYQQKSNTGGYNRHHQQ